MDQGLPFAQSAFALRCNFVGNLRRNAFPVRYSIRCARASVGIIPRSVAILVPAAAVAEDTTKLRIARFPVPAGSGATAGPVSSNSAATIAMMARLIFSVTVLPGIVILAGLLVARRTRACSRHVFARASDQLVSFLAHAGTDA